jgi:hypothetical protein
MPRGRDRLQKCWTVILEGRRYGPYNTAQMKVLAAEGRLVPHSQVCLKGQQPKPASEYPELVNIFRSGLMKRLS